MAKNKIPILPLIGGSIGGIIAITTIIIGIVDGSMDVSISDFTPFIFMVFLMFSFMTVYFTLMKLKGKLIINLVKTNFETGEDIQGTITLIPRKKINVNKLTVKLIGEKKAYEEVHYVNFTTNKGGRKETTPLDKTKQGASYWDEFYNNTIQIDIPNRINNGQKINFPFKIKVPNKAELATKKISKNILENIVNIPQKSDETGELKWKLEANLDSKGIDFLVFKGVDITILDKE